MQTHAHTRTRTHARTHARMHERVHAQWTRTWPRTGCTRHRGKLRPGPDETSVIAVELPDPACACAFLCGRVHGHAQASACKRARVEQQLGGGGRRVHRNDGGRRVASDGGSGVEGLVRTGHDRDIAHLHPRFDGLWVHSRWAPWGRALPAECSRTHARRARTSARAHRIQGAGTHGYRPAVCGVQRAAGGGRRAAQSSGHSLQAAGHRRAT